MKDHRMRGSPCEAHVQEKACIHNMEFSKKWAADSKRHFAEGKMWTLQCDASTHPPHGQKQDTDRPTCPRGCGAHPEFPDAAGVDACTLQLPRSPTHPATGPIPSTLGCSPEKRKSHPYRDLHTVVRSSFIRKSQTLGTTQKYPGR